MSRKPLFGMFALVLLCLCSKALRADGDITPLDVKTGLWESTTVMNMGGLPPIPQEMLDKMTPEQKAQLDAAMKAQQGKPTITKHCVTKEDLNKKDLFDEGNKNCTRTIATSSSRKLVMNMECVNENMKTTGTIHLEASDSENVTGKVDMAATGNGRTMNLSSVITAKYLGSACGDIK
jgi:Protein of unknown function (DUF3617)